jgi:hypothetical protein
MIIQNTPRLGVANIKYMVEKVNECKKDSTENNHSKSKKHSTSLKNKESNHV